MNTNQSFGGGNAANFALPGVTYAVRRLILLNAAVFAVQLLLAPAGALLGVNGVVWLGFTPGDFMRGCLWQPLTYQFLHGGLMHLFMNMLWLYFFGPEVERLLGSRQFVRFYLGCGALGVLLSVLSLVLWGNNPVIVGASGAVMGVMVAFAMVDPQRQFVLFPLPVPVSAVWLVVIVAFMNVATALNGGGDTSAATHLGGMAAGYGLMKAIPLYHQWRRERRRGQWTGPGKTPSDRARDAVDNIFKFKDRD